MRPHFVCTALLALSTLVSSAFAQGSDLCASAQAITGTGTFAFDNTSAATDGAPDPLCNIFSTSQIELDVWFLWTAPASGVFTIATCGLASIDTRIAAYDGSCAGVVLACNDDTCALQSSIDVNVTNGNVYVIRLGVYPSAVPGTGSFSIGAPGQLAVLDTRVNPANGHTYSLLAGGSWSSAEATAISLGGHLATVDDLAEHDWIRTQYHNWGGVDVDLWIGLNDIAVEGTFVWADGTPVVYTNWDLAEPNNGAGGEDSTAMRKNNPAAFWNDLANAPTGFHANPHGVVEVGAPPATIVCAGDGSGTACPCGNNSVSGAGEGCVHSLGGAGKLRAIGNPSITTDSLALHGTQMPSAPCLYFQGNTAISSGAGVGFGDGLRCPGGATKRLGLKTNVSGESQYPTGGDLSVSVRGQCAPGDSRVYQIWFRNAAPAFCTPSTFNLTNGLQLTWQP